MALCAAFMHECSVEVIAVVSGVHQARPFHREMDGQEYKTASFWSELVSAGFCGSKLQQAIDFFVITIKADDSVLPGVYKGTCERGVCV